MPRGEGERNELSRIVSSARGDEPRDIYEARALLIGGGMDDRVLVPLLMEAEFFYGVRSAMVVLPDQYEIQH
jgi:hypothetical protein